MTEHERLILCITMFHSLDETEQQAMLDVLSHAASLQKGISESDAPFDRDKIVQLFPDGTIS